MTEYQVLIQKNIKVLNKFLKLLEDVDSKIRLYGMLNSWNKYIYDFELDNNDVLKLVYEINLVFKNKKNELDNPLLLHLNDEYKKEFECNKVNNSKELKNKTMRYIADNLDYYTNDSYQNSNDFNLNNFLSWLEDMSKCIDLSVFRTRIYMLMEKYKRLNKISKKYNIYINPDSKKESKIVGSLYNKQLRNCSLLDKNRCGEECEWVPGRFFGGTCKNKDYVKLLMETYCSFDSYRSREELIMFIKSLNVDNLKIENYKKLNKSVSAVIKHNDVILDLNTLSDNELCDKFKMLLDYIVYTADLNTIEGQINLYKKLGAKKGDVYDIMSLIRNCRNNGYTTFETTRALIGWISKNKKFKYLVASGTVIVGVVVLGSLILYSSNGGNLVENKDDTSKPPETPDSKPPETVNETLKTDSKSLETDNKTSNSASNPGPSPRPSITQTPSPTSSITQTPSPTSSITQTPSPQTSSITQTPSPQTSSITQTPSPTSSITQTPSQTSSITQTPSPQTSSITPTSSQTSSITQTSSQTSSITPTSSQTSSITPTSSITTTPSSTPSPTPSITPTSSITTTSSQTSSITPTPSSTPSISSTSPQTSSITPTPSSTPSITATSPQTPSITTTSSQTPSITSKPSQTPSITPAPSSTPLIQNLNNAEFSKSQSNQVKDNRQPITPFLKNNVFISELTGNFTPKNSKSENPYIGTSLNNDKNDNITEITNNLTPENPSIKLDAINGKNIEFIYENKIELSKISENNTISQEKLNYIEKLFSLPRISYNSIYNKFWGYFGYYNNEAINKFVKETNINELNSVKMDTNLTILPNELIKYKYDPNNIKNELISKYRFLNDIKNGKYGPPNMQIDKMNQLNSDINHLKNLENLANNLFLKTNGRISSIYNGNNVSYKNSAGQNVKFTFEIIRGETVEYSDIVLNGNYENINSEKKIELLSNAQEDSINFYKLSNSPKSTKIVTLIKTLDGKYYSSGFNVDEEIIYCNITECISPIVSNIINVDTNDIESVLEIFGKLGIPNV